MAAEFKEKVGKEISFASIGWRRRSPRSLRDLSGPGLGEPLLRRPRFPLGMSIP